MHLEKVKVEKGRGEGTVRRAPHGTQPLDLLCFAGANDENRHNNRRENTSAQESESVLHATALRNQTDFRFSNRGSDQLHQRALC